MNVQNPKPERTDYAWMKTWMKTIAILLVGLAVGVILIYAVQPPPPTPGSLLYEVTLFTSDQPIIDFTPNIQFLQKNLAKSVFLQPGSDLAGNIHFSSEPRMLTRFNFALLNQNTPYRTLTGLQFEVRGDPIRDRIRTSLKIGANGAQSSHSIELGDGEYRVVEVICGEKDQRRWCYAIVTVQRAKAPPPRTMVAPRAAPVDVTETPIP